MPYNESNTIEKGEEILSNINNNYYYALYFFQILWARNF